MKIKNPFGVLFLLVILFATRVLLGIQINFSHEDYEQIYLIGLEYALLDEWSYWGPDVVWSKTRLSGGMQGFLVGFPLLLTQNLYAPIVFSNTLSSAGLILLALYAKKRFPKLSLSFLLAFFLLYPFGLFNGVVLLNTAYLFFSGAVLFISFAELFLYRNNLLHHPWLYFFGIGFTLMFTFQLHLSWVLFLPFITFLFYLEWSRNPNRLFGIIACFILGGCISSLTLFPTLFKYGDVILTGAEGNITFKYKRIFAFFDLLIRYLGTVTTDVIHNRSFIKLFYEKNWMGFFLIWTTKIFAIFQFIGICISLLLVKQSSGFKKTVLVFFLTLLMALFLFILSNKHLSMRTYILFYPIPIWLSLYVYSSVIKYSYVKWGLNSSVSLMFIMSIGIAVTNYNGQYSFKTNTAKIVKAMQSKNPYKFAERRKTLMDKYK